ncbi:TIGR03086 family metal-binding protein [Gordonia sp. CPCC 205515]|uniref:TIGR03086 family metal-binding protein n=1 Tax=Gordonia sp. CPCC 205515 TaxID=3140791 RepID=UPI003AF3B525
MTTTQPADPRPVYSAATRWVTDLLTNVREDQLDSLTPCDEFDVRALAGHLIGTAGRAVALGEAGDVLAVSSRDDRYDATTYEKLTDRAIELWSDDAKLSAPVRVPWGEVPGAGALWGYVNETLVHGWDLAVATGQDSEPDAALAEATLVIAKQFIPAEIRADDAVPFSPVVEPRPGAGATERLANWSGRSSEQWVSSR